METHASPWLVHQQMVADPLVVEDPLLLLLRLLRCLLLQLLCHFVLHPISSQAKWMHFQYPWDWILKVTARRQISEDIHIDEFPMARQHFAGTRWCGLGELKICHTCRLPSTDFLNLGKFFVHNHLVLAQLIFRCNTLHEFRNRRPHSIHLVYSFGQDSYWLLNSLNWICCGKDLNAIMNNLFILGFHFLTYPCKSIGSLFYNLIILLLHNMDAWMYFFQHCFPELHHRSYCCDFRVVRNLLCLEPTLHNDYSIF